MTASSQRGATLIVAIIMLVLLTLVALSSFSLGKGNLQLADNAQQKLQTTAAAQAVVDQVISSGKFTTDPANMLPAAASGCPTGVAAPANSRCVDAYGDGRTVVVVTASPQPTCLQMKPVTSWDLQNEAFCSSGIQQGTAGIEGAGTGAACYDTLWEINASATEPKSNASVDLTEGVAIRVTGVVAATSCL